MTLESWVGISFEEVRGAGNISYFKLNRPDEIRENLLRLEKFELFTEDIAGIRRTALGFEQSTGEITVDSNGKAQLLSFYQRLRNKIITVIELFDSVNYNCESEGFDIKLPNGISLSDLSKCARDLDTIFSTCPLFAGHQDTITFKAVDVGSIWLSFVVGGAAAVGILRLIAELVDKAIVIRSHYLSSRAQEEQVRGLNLGNELLEGMIESHKTVQKALLEKACVELAEQNELKDPEELERLRNSINLLSEWMNKGMEIYASVQASPEVKAVFPPIEKQALPEGAVGMLTGGNSNEE